MDLIAKLPCIAAKIYRNLYREGSSIGAIDSNLDWSHNFTNMLGYSEPQFTELMRLYLTIHRCNLQYVPLDYKQSEIGLCEFLSIYASTR